MAEIAGLTIAVFDQLLKLTERTIQFVSDARTLDETVRSLEQKIRDEHNRSEQLRILLFTPSPVYDGHPMFDFLIEDIQDQIKILLVEAVGKLREAVELLDKRYSRPVPDDSTTESPKLGSRSSSGSLLERIRRSPSSPFRLVQWSFRDKNRAQTIVAEFTELNRRIHENIKLFLVSFSLSLNDERHLHHLQHSKASQQLGFDIDATLRLHAQASEHSIQSYDLTPQPWGSTPTQQPWESALSTAVPVPLDNRFAVSQVMCPSPVPLILEYRRYQPAATDRTGDVDERTRRLLNWLARLLNQHKEEIFLIPRCRGWSYIPSQGKIAFVFEQPSGCIGKPVSLLALLRGESRPRLSLNERFQIAFSLARSLSQLQMVQWVHESIRSENILFFAIPDENELGGSRVDYTRPWVFGFEFSRPETFVSHGLTDVSIERDVYRHPDRQGRPSVKFQKVHDIYALGVVMLEIGLWESWDQMQKVKAAYQSGGKSLQSLLIQHAARYLSRRMGDKYRDIVVKCLSGHFVMAEDTREELNLQQAYRAEVVDVLEKLLSSI